MHICMHKYFLTEVSSLLSWQFAFQSFHWLLSIIDFGCRKSFWIKKNDLQAYIRNEQKSCIRFSSLCTGEIRIKSPAFQYKKWFLFVCLIYVMSSLRLRKNFKNSAGRLTVDFDSSRQSWAAWTFFIINLDNEGDFLFSPPYQFCPYFHSPRQIKHFKTKQKFSFFESASNNDRNVLSIGIWCESHQLSQMKISLASQ